MITVGVVSGVLTDSDNRFLCVDGLRPLVEAISSVWEDGCKTRGLPSFAASRDSVFLVVVKVHALNEGGVLCLQFLNL